MSRRIVVLAEAAADIEHAVDFYNRIEPGVGSYFRDSIISELRRLGLYFGQHPVHAGAHRALTARFPFAIYYREREQLRQVIAVLDMRRDPEWIRRQLASR